MIDKSKVTPNKTQSLFLELNGWDSDKAVYTLGDEDVIRSDKVIPSIRQLYVAMGDVHEYKFAITYFYSWKHWQKIASSPTVGPHVEEWRQELQAKIQSANLDRMADLAAEGDRMAIKYMANTEWKEDNKPTPKRGRPSKEEKEGFLKQEAAELGRIDDDFDRIMQ